MSKRTVPEFLGLLLNVAGMVGGLLIVAYAARRTDAQLGGMGLPLVVGGGLTAWMMGREAYKTLRALWMRSTTK